MKRARDVITRLDDATPSTVLTTHDVAAILHCDTGTAARLLAEGKIPGGFHVGAHFRILVKDLQKWIDGEKLPKNPRAASLRASARSRRS